MYHALTNQRLRNISELRFNCFTLPLFYLFISHGQGLGQQARHQQGADQGEQSYVEGPIGIVCI